MAPTNSLLLAFLYSDSSYTIFIVLPGASDHRRAKMCLFFLTKTSPKPGPNCVVLSRTKWAYARRNSEKGATFSKDHDGACTSQMVSMSK